MTYHPPGPRCAYRAIEWMAMAMMLGIALTILATPRTVTAGSFRYVVELGLWPGLMASLFILIGTARGVALYLNGQWYPHGPRLRAIGALAGAVIWSLMALALAYLTFDTGTISMGVPVYACLAGGEIYSCFRAGADVRNRLGR